MNPAKQETSRYLANVESRAAVLRGLADESVSDAKLHTRTQSDNYYQSLRDCMSKIKEHPKSLSCVGFLLIILACVQWRTPVETTEVERNFNSLIECSDELRDQNEFDLCHEKLKEADHIAKREKRAGFDAVVSHRLGVLALARNGGS